MNPLERIAEERIAEAVLRGELVRLSDLLEAAVGDGARAELRRRLTAGRLRYELLMERRRPSAAHFDYGASVRARLAGGAQL